MFAPYITETPFEKIQNYKCPEATKSHTPIPHFELIQQVKRSLNKTPLNVTDEAHQLTHDDHRYFGVLQLSSEEPNLKLSDGQTLLMGLRNSNDKAFSLGIASGNQTKVCSNGLFTGEVTVNHKHSVHVLDYLPHLIDKALTGFLDLAATQSKRLECFKERELSTQESNDLFIKSLEAGCIPASKLPKAISLYKDPPHPEFKERNLLNWIQAFTELYKSDPVNTVMQRSRKLYNLCEDYCDSPVLAVAT